MRRVWVCASVAVGLMLLAVTSASCAQSQLPSAQKPFDRFFFSASGIRGVLEVNAAPPSICYETQSFPARPIEIVSHPAEVPAAVAASYSPRRGTYCDRSVSEAVARDIIDHPFQYTISWRPDPRENTQETAALRSGRPSCASGT